MSPERPERIKPAWRCKNKKHTGVYTGPGECSTCGTKLQKFTPISDLPHVFRCSICRGQFTEEPPRRKGHKWLCPNCETPTIIAYGCEEAYLKKISKIKSSKPTGKKGSKTKPYQFSNTVKKMFDVTDSVSRSAFEAQSLAEKLSHRNPQGSDDQSYIDHVEFDLSRFNIRAQMVVDMVVVKSLLEEAGLVDYVPGALDRILDARLGLRRERKVPKTENPLSSKG